MSNTIDPIRVGCDWVYWYTTDKDVSGWSDLVIQIRKAAKETSTLIASSYVVATEAPIVTTGVVPLGVPPTNFATGVMTGVIRAADTVDIDPSKNCCYELEILAKIDGVETTVRPATPIKVLRRTAVAP